MSDKTEAGKAGFEKEQGDAQVVGFVNAVPKQKIEQDLAEYEAEKDVPAKATTSENQSSSICVASTETVKDLDFSQPTKDSAEENVAKRPSVPVADASYSANTIGAKLEIEGKLDQKTAQDDQKSDTMADKKDIKKKAYDSLRPSSLPHYERRNKRGNKTAAKKDNAALALAPPRPYVHSNGVDEDQKSLNKKAFASMQPPSLSHYERRNKRGNKTAAKKDNATLALAPPRPFVYRGEVDEEQKQEEIAPQEDICHEETRPGAERVGGISWDGNEEDDNLADFPTENTDSSRPTNEYLAEAHIVKEPILVAATPDSWLRRNRWWIFGGSVVIFMIIIVVVVSTTVGTSDLPTPAPTSVAEGVEEYIRILVENELPVEPLNDEAIDWVTKQRIAEGDISYTDQRALVQYSLVTLYLSTTDDDMELVKTDRLMGSDEECHWYGVSCEDGVPTGLTMANDGLKGSIPPAISLLSNSLTNLDLSQNSLNGFLPSEMFALTQLSILNLSHNAFQGGVPNTINQATNLTRVDLSENQLDSTIPPEIGDVSALTSLNLSNNDMIGSIPSQIGYLSMLEELDLCHNSFSYGLPSEMGHLTTLTKLNLQNNDFLGPLPSEIGLMKSLRDWNMSNNHVFNKIPASLWQDGSQLQNLEALDLSHNLLTGDTSDTLLFGASWKKLTSLRLGKNFIRGKVDDSTSKINIFGAISRNLPNLEELDVSSNFFSGTVPNGLLDMRNLKVLNLGKSGIKFDSRSFPNVTPKLPHLEQLDLSDCNVKGSIPSTIGLLNQLKSIVLDSNLLEGQIPSEVGNLVALNELSLRSNRLIGSVPVEIGNLNALTTLHLEYNALTGTIPTELGGLVHLKELYLYGTFLEGTIPLSLCDMDQANTSSIDTPNIRVDCDEVVCHCCHHPTCDYDQCYVNVGAICTPDKYSTEDCGSIAVTKTRCEDTPLAQVFRYTGGTCEQSDNLQNPDFFQCFDFQGGPPVNAGETSFITVTDIKDGSIIYHANTVAVGDEFTVADPPFGVEANINITIWRSTNTSMHNMLQTVVFNTICDQNLFLMDRFGASQLVVFVNEQQGLQSVFFNATFTLIVDSSISSNGTVFIESLTSNTNHGKFNFTDDLHGWALEPGESLTKPPSFELVLDISVVTNNVVSTILTARDSAGKPCQMASDIFSFTTGLALPPNVPTRDPTSAPTRTPVPTPDPEDTSCAIRAIVDCIVLNGGLLLDCNNIARPTSTKCLTVGYPRGLGFIYRGGDCVSSTTSQTFNCEGSADLDEVWITIISENSNILWSRITTRGTIIDLRGIDNAMEVSIYEVVNGRPDINNPLQTMSFASSCTETSDLNLLDTFGALELIEFSVVVNYRLFTMSAFAFVEIVYAVQLQSGSSLPAYVSEAKHVGGPNNNQVQNTLHPPFDPNPIGPKDTLEFATESLVLNLLDGSTTTGYSFELEVRARNVFHNRYCDDIASQEITVG